jgi:hypothetical protein
LGILAVKAVFKEVREVTMSKTTIIFDKNTMETAQNASSANKTSIGQVQAQAPQASVPGP